MTKSIDHQVRSPPAKLRKTTALTSMRRRVSSPFTADRHSCLAAPYAATDPRTKRFFELVISKAGAPVVCGFAGKRKGKAIYADADLPKNTRVWTEPPYVAMQHELNNRAVPCCQYCFVPLIGDYKQQWMSMAAQWNERQQTLHNGEMWPAMATPQDLDDVVERLRVQRRTCGLAAPAVRCACGDTYCSKLCQIRAYHEFHAILCPRDDPFSAMRVFMRHTQETNDIFLLAAKVIARVLSRYLVSQDVIKAREPMDMFHKKPWWEVVMIEKQVQQRSSNSTHTTSSSSGSNDDEDERGERIRDAQSSQNGNDDEIPSPPPQITSSESRFLKDLLVSTHQLLLDALESNLVHLEREDQLQGHSVDEIWTSCASILSFEFFAAQLGLFEMNNIRVEIDHPFHALMEVLDQSNEPRDDYERELFTRVLSVLQYGEQQRIRAQLDNLERDGMAPDASHADELIRSGMLRGFPSIDGTALFSIICTMNHSCDPNCTVLYTKNGDAHVVAVRDILKGEELCICYIDIDQDVHEREAMLKEYQFRCLCPRCTFERRQQREREYEPTTAHPESKRVDVDVEAEPAAAAAIV